MDVGMGVWRLGGGDLENDICTASLAMGVSIGNLR